MVPCTFVLDNNAKKVRLVCAGPKVLIVISQVELKKSYKADLEHQRVSGFLLGLIVVLSLFLVCLEFTLAVFVLLILILNEVVVENLVLDGIL